MTYAETEYYELLLQNRDELFRLVEDKEKRFFHPKSVENFIYHFRAIDSFEDRVRIFNILMEYMATCKRHVQKMDQRKSRSLYSSYIYKVGIYYHNNLEFVNFDLGVHLFKFSLLIGLLAWLFGFKGVIAFFFVLATRTFYYWKKYKKKRTFSLFF